MLLWCRSTRTSPEPARPAASTALRAAAPRTWATPSARPAPWATTRPAQVRSALGPVLPPSATPSLVPRSCSCWRFVPPNHSTLSTASIGCSLGVPGSPTWHVREPDRRHLLHALVSSAMTSACYHCWHRLNLRAAVVLPANFVCLLPPCRNAAPRGPTRMWWPQTSASRAPPASTATRRGPRSAG